MILKHASFFTGIGGLDLGFEGAGITTVFQCEIKPFCREVLRRHWNTVPRANDIRRLSHETIPLADIWTAGFPCQDISLARMGARSGLNGDQSGLFFDFIKLVGESLPGTVVLENVHGLLSSHKGKDFETILKLLDELGYGVAWRVLNSKDFGVPQSRRRVYIVAMHRDWQGPGQVLFEPECGNGHTKKSKKNGEKSISPFKKVLGNLSKGPIVKGIAHCVYAESARHTGTDWSRNYVSYPDGRVRRFTPAEVEAVQGFPRNWTLPEHSKLSSDKIDSLRYHAVGNAVTVPVSEWIGRRIKEVLLMKSLPSSVTHPPLVKSSSQSERSVICD